MICDHRATERGSSEEATLRLLLTVDTIFYFYFSFFLHTYIRYFPASGQAVWSQVSSLLPSGSCLQFSSHIGFISPTARRFFIETRVLLLTHALALSGSQFVHKKKSPRIFTSMHSGGFELTKLTYIPGSRIARYATGATGV